MRGRRKRRRVLILRVPMLSVVKFFQKKMSSCDIECKRGKRGVRRGDQGGEWREGGFKKKI